MYIQITTKCNMTCAHCCFNCTMKGRNMSMDTFEAACKFAKKYGHDIFIGGGEPTIHPKFWAMLGMALTYNLNENGKVGLVTNGSMTETSLRLAELARNGIISCSLSQDEYHDCIDPLVIHAFKDNNPGYDYYVSNNDLRKIRNVGNNLIAAGRAKINQFSSETGCCCSDLFVTPTGRIYSCGCKNNYLGSVYDDPDIENYNLFECRGVA